MSGLRYNDNELLYLISQQNEIALELLLEKYTPLIKKRLFDFRIKSCNYDDFYQECLITFFSTIQKFREEKNGVFNLYLDYAIKNKIKALIKKEEKYFYNVTLMENLEYVSDDVNDMRYNFQEPQIGLLSDFEKTIYHKYYLECYKIADISKELGCDIKRIYNALTRIKNKILVKCCTVKKEKYPIADIPKGMSELEFEVYKKYANGKTTREIASELSLSFKKVANALSRAKAKVKHKL